MIGTPLQILRRSNQEGWEEWSVWHALFSVLGTDVCNPYRYFSWFSSFLPGTYDTTINEYHMFFSLSFSYSSVQHYPVQWRRCQTLYITLYYIVLYILILFILYILILDLLFFFFFVIPPRDTLQGSMGFQKIQ